MKLKIENLELLQITKVKPWVIYFKYDGEHYMLHENVDGYESTTTLYKKEVDKGHYKLESLLGRWGSIDVFNYVGDYGSKHGMPYSHIKKDIFVKRLVKEGFSEGLYESEYKAFLEKDNGMLLAIKAIEKERDKLYKEYWS